MVKYYRSVFLYLGHELEICTLSFFFIMNIYITVVLLYFLFYFQNYSLGV